MTLDSAALPEMLQLEQVDEHRYAGMPEHSGDRRNVVFGGQILAQMIVAGHLDRNVDRVDDKEVKSIHAIFARAGDYGAPIEYEVERMHDGRTLGSDTITFSQNGRIMSRALVVVEQGRTRPDPPHRERGDAARRRTRGRRPIGPTDGSSPARPG